MLALCGDIVQRLASALVRLKGIFPTANAALLIARRPFLALHEDLTAVEAAGLELRDMLPGVDVDRRAPVTLSALSRLRLFRMTL